LFNYERGPEYQIDICNILNHFAIFGRLYLKHQVTLPARLAFPALNLTN